MYVIYIYIYCAVYTHIFQSSPQILITTGFIIKSTVPNSPIVYVSLLTSLWSLCDRVAQDDKPLFEEEWRPMIENKLPNPRWFLRVFGWRFLEISSRICLFTLIWINLGGLSVFIILSAELLYLVIISLIFGKFSIFSP